MKRFEKKGHVMVNGGLQSRSATLPGPSQEQKEKWMALSTGDLPGPFCLSAEQSNEFRKFLRLNGLPDVYSGEPSFRKKHDFTSFKVTTSMSMPGPDSVSIGSLKQLLCARLRVAEAPKDFTYGSDPKGSHIKARVGPEWTERMAEKWATREERPLPVNVGRAYAEYEASLYNHAFELLEELPHLARAMAQPQAPWKSEDDWKRSMRSILEMLGVHSKTHAHLDAKQYVDDEWARAFKLYNLAGGFLSTASRR